MIYVLIPSSLSNPLHLSHSGPSHRGAEAAATHGAPELSKRLLGNACGVEALGQQHNAVEEEKGGQTIDDILEILNAEKESKRETSIKTYNNRDYNLRNPLGRLKRYHCNDGHLHVGKRDVVLKVSGKVRLNNSLRLCECLVPTAAEEGNAREAQQCGDQGAVWYPTQAAHTAVIATC